MSFTVCDLLCHMLNEFGSICGLSVLHINLCVYVWVHIVLITLALEHVLIFGKVNYHSLPLIFRTFLAMFVFLYEP